MTCRVELTSQDNVDDVTWHNCLDFPGINEVTRDKRGAIGGFKQVTSEHFPKYMKMYSNQDYKTSYTQAI